MVFVCFLNNFTFMQLPLYFICLINFFTFVYLFNLLCLFSFYLCRLIALFYLACFWIYLSLYTHTYYTHEIFIRGLILT